MSVERIEVNGHELTAFDLPPEPSNTYHVWVDGIGEIVVEKSKPPKEKDVPAMYMRKLVPELCEQNAELHAENAKLRELVRKVEHYEQYGCYECPHHDGCNAHTLYDIAKCTMQLEIERDKRELGIEVDDA